MNKPPPSSSPSCPPVQPIDPSPSRDRNQRLGAALRENLKRRKQQRRGRADMPDEGSAPDGEGNQPGHGDRAGAALDATEGQAGGNPTKSG